MAAKVKGKWVRRSVSGQRAVLSRFAASGMGVAAFCRGEGISAASLRRWRSQQGKAVQSGVHAQPERAPRFVDLGAFRTVSVTGRRLEVKLDLGDGLLVHLVRG
jgi:putative transposase